MKRAILPVLFFAGGLYAQTVPDCPRAGQQPACKGECGQFVDRNGDGTCDTCEEEARKAAEAAKKKPAAPKVTPRSMTAPSVASAPDKGEIKSPAPKIPESFYEKLRKFSLIPLLSAVLLLIVLSEILKAKIPKYLLFHRDIWNWLLFLSFFSCALSGFFLYFSVFPEYKNFLFRLHLWGGFISFIASSYHFLERYRCMTPFKKCL